MTATLAGLASAGMVAALGITAHVAWRGAGLRRVRGRLFETDQSAGSSTLAPAFDGATETAAAQGARHTFSSAEGMMAYLRSQAAALWLPGDAGRAGVALGAATLGLPVGTLVVAGQVLAVVVALAVTLAIVVLRRSAPRRRAAAIDRELPTALESVARRLRAGGSLAQAIAAAQPSEGSVLAAGWTRMAALCPAVGVTAAVDDWAAASDRPSVHLAAAALVLANDTGGAPARAVDGVAATLRSRLAVAGEVRALTSQSRTSAVVIAVAPLVFGAVAGATDPRTAAFLTTPAGNVVLAAGLFLDALGAWWMVRLCRPPA